MMNDETLVGELKKATDGLFWMSESDYPLEVFAWDGAQEISHAYLRRAAGSDAETRVEETRVEDFFRVAAGEQEWKGAAELARARRFQTLAQLLAENLEDVRVYRVGEINIGVYIVGRSAGGHWLGVSTRVVET